MRSPTAQTRHLALVASLLLGILLSALLIWRASYAAFSATTVNEANNWTAGTVALSDDDSEAALFSVSGLKPGSTGTKCIEVTYGGSLPSDIGLYGTVTDDAVGDTLDSYLDLEVTYDSTTTGTFAGGCGDFSAEGTVFTGGTLEDFGANHTDYSNGAGSWSATTGQSRVFMFVYTLDVNAPDTVQGDGATATFTWEAQNT